MPTKPILFAAALSLLGALCLSAPAKAQLQTATDDSILDSTYAGEHPSDAGINAELETKLTRNDNVFSNNARPYSDFIYEEGVLINLWKSKQRWNVAFQYRPTLLHYQDESSLNSFDQDLKLAGAYDFTPRFRFQGTQTFDVIKGLLQPSSDEYFSLPTSTLPGLNQTLITPTARSLSDGSEGHLLYDVSPRGSFDFMGSYAIENFSDVKGLQPPPNTISVTLLDMNSTSGGASYQYRLTPRFTLGARYLYQYFHYGLGGSDESQTVFLTTHFEIGPRVSLDLYGGPSHSVAYGLLAQTSSISVQPGTFKTLSPAVGGTFTLRSDQTVFDLTAQHMVTSGGGLLMTVTTTYEGAEVRHRLGENWDFVVLGSNARTLALQSQSEQGKINTQSVGTAFERALFEKLSVHFEYDFVRQRVNQFVPLGTNVNTNQFSVSLFYRLGEPRL